MQPSIPRDQIDVPKRKLLLSMGSLLAGAGAVELTTSDRARAAVSTTDIDIPPTTVETPDGDIETITCEVTGNFEFATNNADQTRLDLRVAPPDGEFATIDTTTQETGAATGSGSYSLSGSVLAHENISASLFAVEPEQTHTVSLPVQVVLTVLFQDEPVVEALAEGAAEVTVESGEIVASATVLGEGEVTVTV